MLLFHKRKLFEIDNKQFFKFQKQLQSFNLEIFNECSKKTHSLHAGIQYFDYPMRIVMYISQFCNYHEYSKQKCIQVCIEVKVK
jgi:hypothetical protein